MRVKITQPGWQAYNGPLGMAQFVDGVSVDDISRREALALGAFVHVVEIDADGNELGPVSPAHEAIKATTMTTTTKRDTVREHIQVEPSDHVEVENLSDTVKEDSLAEARRKQAEAERPTVKTWSRTELEGVANSKGIHGLREIADPLKVKGTSIKGLIDGIEVAQSASTRPAA